MNEKINSWIEKLNNNEEVVITDLSHIYAVFKNCKRWHSKRYISRFSKLKVNGLIKDNILPYTKKQSKFYGELKPRKDYYSNPKFYLYDEEN